MRRWPVPDPSGLDLQILCGLLSVALGVIGCGAASPCGPASATVTNAVDGDTIDLDVGLRIRLLLVDAPETTKGKHDCYGLEASRYTADTLVGQPVALGYDTQCLDRYGRTLAYVAVDGRDFNAELVSNGYACVEYIAPDGMSRRQQFEDLESVAKTNRVGVWGHCDPVTCTH